LLCAPLVLVLVLAALAQGLRDQPLVDAALRGMGVVAGGLVLATAIKLAPGLRANPLGRAPAMAFVAATVWMIAWLRWPLPWVVLALRALRPRILTPRIRTRSRRSIIASVTTTNRNHKTQQNHKQNKNR
jgi:chromate transporter